MRKEYIVTEIRASLDGSPYVFISVKSPDEVRGPRRVETASITSFNYPEDIFNNLGNVISKQFMGSFATVIKLSLDEYEKLDVKVGDRISIDINKIQVVIL